MQLLVSKNSITTTYELGVKIDNYLSMVFNTVTSTNWTLELAAYTNAPEVALPVTIGVASGMASFNQASVARKALVSTLSSSQSVLVLDEVENVQIIGRYVPSTFKQNVVNQADPTDTKPYTITFEFTGQLI